MKKIILPLALVAAISITACNNNSGEDPSLKARADSLYEQLMDGHDAGMAKMKSLDKWKVKVNAAIDSIDKLPAKAKESLSGYRGQLDSLRNDLDYAETAMDKWMQEIRIDTLQSNVKERINYYANENEKVQKVKDAILGSLKKAETVVREKF